MSPLRLYGVAALDAAPGEEHPLASGTHTVSFRDLGAVVSEIPLARPQMSQDELATYRRVVEEVFASRAVLPAPAGVVFRAADALGRWLELHYVTLSDALAYVEGRSCARVHVSRGLA
ncbi:MAG TPA: GvpL/GvpF family gas vesicle protein, partial [Gemmatimonadaceae bacterium]|nr:GvpL/GvpF family gas vesicle protein [Gemmatimonadaceae bacterium]